MSKAFDSVNRTVLINNLNKILEKDEVHLLKLMIGAPIGPLNPEFTKQKLGIHVITQVYNHVHK